MFLPIIPDNINIHNVNDLYNYFGFSTDEIAKINIFSIPIYKYQQLSCDGKTLLNGNSIPNIKDQNTKKQENEENSEDELESDDEPDTNEVKSKKSPIKLDEKTELVHVTEANEGVSIAIPSPIPKKKRTIKKRPKLILGESSHDKVPKKPIEPNANKIFNPLTKRYVKNIQANRKKIEKLTLKLGGKSKKRTRRNKCIYNGISFN